MLGTNDALADDPASVNRDPYGDGWFFQVKLADIAQLDDLLTPQQYEQLVAEG